MRREFGLFVLCLVTLTTACGEAETTDDIPVSVAATPEPAASPIATPTPRPTRELVTPAGHLVGDGVCDARVPLTWSEDAPGTGTTGGGHAFSIFGNVLASPDAWDTAATLLRNQAVRQPDAQLTEGDDFIQITYADAAGMAYRGHFAGVYCDIRITGRGDPISAAERATWEEIIASLEPVR